MIVERARIQSSRIASWQLHAAGATRTQIWDWVRAGWLIRLLPRVYAVGDVIVAGERESLWEAILYAGPGAALSHLTAAWWRAFIQYPARDGIHVSTPRQIRSLPGIVVHDRRTLVVDWHRGIPVTTPNQTALDVGTAGDPRLVQLSLSELDFQRRLDVPALREMTRRGRPGSALLNAAIDRYAPEFARLKSPGEIEFLELCQRGGIDPLPETNVTIEPGLIVDALFRDARLVAEIDGTGNHGTPEQLLRDARRDMRLRALGFEVVRYRVGLIRKQGDLVLADVRAQLAKLERLHRLDAE